MLTDLIAAAADDAAALVAAPGHATLWPTLDGRGLNKTALAALALVLLDRPVTPASLGVAQLGFQLLVDEGGDGPWLDRLPDALTTALAQLPGDQVVATARAWAAVPEAGLARWPAPELQLFLADLSAFAGSAAARGLPLLLWSCD